MIAEPKKIGTLKVTLEDGSVRELVLRSRSWQGVPVLEVCDDGTGDTWTVFKLGALPTEVEITKETA